MKYKFPAMSYINNLKKKHMQNCLGGGIVFFIFRYFCLAKSIWVKVVLEGKIKQTTTSQKCLTPQGMSVFSSQKRYFYVSVVRITQWCGISGQV